MKRYLLYVTFYAGSDDPEDTDRDLFLMTGDREITEDDMKYIFKEVNSLLDTFNENTDFPISYEQGLNINTLMEGVGIYTKGKVKEIYSNCGEIEKIDNCYVIEQWQ